MGQVFETLGSVDRFVVYTFVGRLLAEMKQVRQKYILQAVV